MEKINIACMVHNAYWICAEKLAKSMECDIDLFGSSMSYFYHRADLDEKDYDTLIVFSTNSHRDNEEEMLDNVSDILLKRGKDKVISAYLYNIPEDERIDDKSDGVKIVYRTFSERCEKSFQVDINYDVNDLIYETIQIYNDGLTKQILLVKVLGEESAKI